MIQTKNALDDSTLQTSQPFELKFDAGAADKGSIEGYLSTFGGPPDSYGDVIDRGAFAKSLAEHRHGGTAPMMLWYHKPDEVVGRWTDLAEDDHGLRVKGQLNLATSRGRDAHASVLAGDVGHLSMGFVPADAKKDANGVRHLTEVHLIEGSIVGRPANVRARLTSVKSVTTKRELEDALRQVGVPRAAACKIVAGGWPALAGADDQAQTKQQRFQRYAERLQRAAQSLRTS